MTIDATRPVGATSTYLPYQGQQTPVRLPDPPVRPVQVRPAPTSSTTPTTPKSPPKGAPGATNGSLPPSAVAAFRQQFGRAPVSAIDAQTARALDPTTTQPKYNGMNSVVTVARINPVPGGGLVRGAFFIPQKSVFNVGENDQGDNRGMRPDFAPDDARATVYVDYENGIVIGRQNPSVTTGDSPYNANPFNPILGQPVSPPPTVKVGTPEFDVQQASDGSVHIHYDAVNPFAPPGAEQTGHTVNGDLYVQPKAGATPTVAGVIGNFPALEIYHDSPTGQRTTLLQDDVENHGALGPLLDLPHHHQVGDPSSLATKFAGTRVPLSGNLYLTTKPYPTTRLGDPKSPPHVAVPPDPNRLNYA